MIRSFVLCSMLALVVAACGQPDNQVAPTDPADEADQPVTPEAAPTPDQPAVVPVKLANPASTHCVEKGGEVEIRTVPGGQLGVCVFDDGSRCEEWRYFRGECEPGDCTSQTGICD